MNLRKAAKRFYKYSGAGARIAQDKAGDEGNVYTRIEFYWDSGHRAPEIVPYDDENGSGVVITLRGASECECFALGCLFFHKFITEKWSSEWVGQRSFPYDIPLKKSPDALQGYLIDPRKRFELLASESIRAGLITQAEVDVISRPGTRKAHYWKRHLRDLKKWAKHKKCLQEGGQ